MGSCFGFGLFGFVLCCISLAYCVLVCSGSTVAQGVQEVHGEPGIDVALGGCVCNYTRLENVCFFHG
jgi:hypothetical protein